MKFAIFLPMPMITEALTDEQEDHILTGLTHMADSIQFAYPRYKSVCKQDWSNCQWNFCIGSLPRLKIIWAICNHFVASLIRFTNGTNRSEQYYVFFQNQPGSVSFILGLITTFLQSQQDMFTQNP